MSMVSFLTRFTSHYSPLRCVLLRGKRKNKIPNLEFARLAVVSGPITRGTEPARHTQNFGFPLTSTFNIALKVDTGSRGCL